MVNDILQILRLEKEGYITLLDFEKSLFEEYVREVFKQRTNNAVRILTNEKKEKKIE